MSSHNRSQSSARRGDYVWQYEYYDDEPVSFEGLKAHRYSIVIGFWVGLAVFVIFMFFVLTMLTKTGAPQQENVDNENLPGPRNGLVNIICQKDDDSDDNNAVSRAFLAESRSYFNFYISKEDEGKRWQNPGTKQNGPQGTFNQSVGTGPTVTEQEDEDTRVVLPFDGLLADETRTDTDCDFLSHFNIPNLVTCEHNSSLGEDDSLCEPPITPDRNM
ncbi:melanocortin-2 receptor accessory protein 2A-like [Hippocampus zosterae]|uniref:melanocortin-2 receptor accessory protein 2A-like n=1 Tax=Hippocampus zosterae TaxID=109293 RepID=UPI00223DC2CF|nr:melanocortin-2 receptor accessory protein 2A-like [Hippocampus zosterae]XP_051909144.1 melanocortin-2 receptor accessory protein 2A-like [Hippocampus zosterae]